MQLPFIHVYIFSVSRDNFLVLDIFFEALNYETIEQKKAYDVAGLLGEFLFSTMTPFSRALVLYKDNNNWGFMWFKIRLNMETA